MLGVWVGVYGVFWFAGFCCLDLVVVLLCCVVGWIGFYSGFCGFGFRIWCVGGDLLVLDGSLIWCG